MAKSKKEEAPVKEIKKKDYEVKLQAFDKESYSLSRPGDKENFVPGWYPYSDFLRAVKLIYPNGVPRSEWLNVDPDENGDFDPLAEDNLKYFGDKDAWDAIKPFEIKDVFKLEKLEHRRFLFRFFGPEVIFNHVDPELVATETIEKTNHRWDANNKPYTEKIKDTYTLWKKPLFHLFPELKERGRTNEMMYIVKMKCTSTAKEHFIFVDRTIGEKNDPIAAIAWTLMPNITNIERIYRQGDIVICKRSKDSKDCPPYHLSKEEYLKKMYAET